MLGGLTVEATSIVTEANDGKFAPVPVGFKLQDTANPENVPGFPVKDSLDLSQACLSGGLHCEGLDYLN